MQDVADRNIAHARRRGRKPSTIQNIESEIRVHLAPFFRDKSIGTIRAADVLDLVTVLEGKGLSPKSIRNITGTLSALFVYSRRHSAAGRLKTPARAWTCPRCPTPWRFGS